MNNNQIDNAKDLDVVIPMYNLIKYRNNYSKTLQSLFQYYRDKPNNDIANSESFQFRIKIPRKAPDNDNKKMLLLKCH